MSAIVVDHMEEVQLQHVEEVDIYRFNRVVLMMVLYGSRLLQIRVRMCDQSQGRLVRFRWTTGARFEGTVSRELTSSSTELI